MGEVGVFPGLESNRFRARRALIHYVEGPRNGPPLILLHGLTRDWTSFSNLFPDLVPRFQVLALDLRGHGESDRVSHGYHILEFAEDVAEFLQSVTPGGAALFGHSLGATVAMQVAADNRLVSALIVGDSFISPRNLAAMYDPLFAQMHKLLLQGESVEQLARGIGRIRLQFPGITESIRLDELPGNNEAVLLKWAQTVIRTAPEALQMTLDRSSHAGWDPERTLPRIACPVLMLQANPALDALLTDADMALAKRLLPRMKHVKFSLLGHALFMQQPKPVLKVVNAFLEEYADVYRTRS
jgi:pimeloyl-ACP methyl ester carboxylesterase